MKTNIYHITYTPELKEVSLYFWNCNFKCKGCLCKKIPDDPSLKENLVAHLEEPNGIAKAPERFLDFEELMQILDKLEIKKVMMMGMEAILDPQYPLLTKTFHEKYGSYNIVCTNLFEMPPLEDTDKVEVGIKAVTDSLNIDYTGESNNKVLENFVKLYKSGVDLVVESVLIPEYIDAEEIERIAEFIASVDKDIFFVLLPYFKSGDNPWRRPTREEIDKAASLAKKHLTNVYSVYGDEELKYEVVRVF
ncbi:radical SAM protein [Dehalogenimonas sp. THU2]|uniref:radical SAM protein n=1 Tax=Dehalogenimonas sp. THU2 TaxID=3151121 RepID=UPI003218D606